MRYDARADAFVASGHRLAEVRAWVAERGIVTDTGEYDVAVADSPPFFDPRVPRDYQQTTVDRWLAGGGRGSVVLPTGADKSFVALLALHATGGRACVVAPTRALVAQWYGQLADAFGAERVAAWYGDEKVLAPITVTTYHSAFPLLEHDGDRFDARRGAGP